MAAAAASTRSRAGATSCAGRAGATARPAGTRCCGSQERLCGKVLELWSWHVGEG